MNILIVGGAGFIGSTLTKGLIQQNGNCKITVMDNLSSGSLDNLKPVAEKIKFVKGNILDSRTVNDTCKGMDIIFHLAARVSVEDSVKNPYETNSINLNATVELLEAAKKHKIKRLIFSSSAAVYGDTEKLPIAETTSINPLSPYALQKYASEQYCKYYSEYSGLETICLRYFNVYGPNQKENSGYAGVIFKFISDAVTKNSIRIDGDGLQTRDFVFIDDVVNANIIAMNANKNCTGQSYNIGTGIETSILDLYKTVAEVLKKDVEAKHAEKRIGDIKKSCANIDKAKAELGYQPRVKLFDGISKTCKWINSR